MMRAAIRTTRALRGARRLHTPLAHGQQASAAKRVLAAAGLATGAVACYATAQSTATCESAAAAKTRFDAAGFYAYLWTCFRLLLRYRLGGDVCELAAAYARGNPAS